MQNVLADLALESEAAMTLSMRMARALDHREDRHEDLLVRLVTAVGKYWICKRTPGHAYEAMECIGGSGVMEDSMFPRLYREAPVNAIWEGSGNIQCLDVLRAMGKTPEVWRRSLQSCAPRKVKTRCWMNRCAGSPRNLPTPPTCSTVPATWSSAWRWRCKPRCWCAARQPSWPTLSALRAWHPRAASTTAACRAAWM